MKKRFRALMLDVDGTLIRYEHKALPSEKIIQSVQMANKIMPVCLATGRSYDSSERIIKSLSLSGLAILCRGGQVIDIKTLKILYEQPILEKDINYIVELFKEFKLPLHTHEGFSSNFNLEKPISDNVLNVFTDEILSKEKADKLIRKLTKRDTISAEMNQHNIPDKFAVSVSHFKATKLHGVYEVSKILGVETDEMIGVGDSHNDFSLLMACGFKVAMGNAVEDLKAIADYVAPSVEEDGLADVIEKFILK
jgi:Cof subfamily protein (haloacid dehalogenase superfamily)